MESFEKKDILNLQSDNFVKSILLTNGNSLKIKRYPEEVQYSCKLIKYNSYGMKQERNLLITNLYLYNLSKQSKYSPHLT
jgi:hypothetical protein